jgi:phosphate acetyltransferase
VLAAVEGVTAALPATGDAAALAKMSTQGVISGGTVAGPLTADSALSSDAARVNGVDDPVAGHADVLIVPGLDAGSLVERTLTAICGALAAGIVLGAKVPVVLGGRNDTMEVRMASCVLASLIAAAQAQQAAAPPAAAVVPVAA